MKNFLFPSLNPVSMVQGSNVFSTAEIPMVTTAVEKTSFWDGANLMGVLGILGASAPQVISAIKGDKVIVDGKDITSEIVATVQNEASSANTSVDEILKILALNNSNNSNNDDTPKDNTILYVAGGVGVVVLALGFMYVSKSKN